jgi:catechol 2,3-dioxygenase-like lactoylglutathione lyase family enzyme
MKINSISGLVYRVNDLDKTVEFYETLGFRIGKREENEATCYVNWFWLRFVADADSDAAVNDAAPTLYLKVDDIDDFYGAVLANGHTPLTEPRKQRTGGPREFLMNDPDGNKLAFFAKK